MKKKLLFVTLYLHTGGVEKSLLSLLSSLDYEKYDVDLLLFDHSGVLFKSVPKEVTILPPLFETFTTPLSQAIPKLIKEKKGGLLAGKLLAPAAAFFSKGIGTGARWAVYQRILKSPQKEYDVAISYLDFFSNYYVTQKVKAKKKIVYNHMDYSSKVGWQHPKLERQSFEKSDYVVSVAETSRRALLQAFPEIERKIRIIHNSVSPTTIKALSHDYQPFKIQEGMTNIVTVSRLVREKGVLLAVEACYRLVKKGYSIKWYLVGNGPLYQVLSTQIASLGLENHFILVGEKENPYPYMALCDIYVQPSLTEAHCVAVEEALALEKPIVLTNIPSFQEQIKDQETGVIAECHPDGLVNGIERLLIDECLKHKLISNLKNGEARNQEELHKFYQLIES